MVGFQFSQHNVNFVGGGSPTIVLAHGFGSNQSAWDRVLPWFASRNRVMLFDLAGSTAANAAFYTLTTHDGLDDYARDLIALLERYGVARCVYVGHGVSGIIGLIASLARPDLFQRVVTIGASPCYLNDGKYPGGLEQTDLDALFLVMGRKYRDWAAGFAEILAGGPAQRAAAEEYAQSLLEVPAPIALSAARTIFQADVRSILPQVRVPTLIVQTRDDPLVPMAVAEHLERHLPHGRLALLEVGGHLPHLTAPERLVRLLGTHGVSQAAAA